MPSLFDDPFGGDIFGPKPKRKSSALSTELDATRPQAIQPQAQTPLEDHSLLASIGHASLSGLSRVGHALDLPGSMVRDVLGGHNPLDQLLHPFSGEGRTSGRDLLRQWGAAGAEDTTPNWWGGLAAELALDPLTYTGVGALTKAGKAAQAAGTLTKGLKPAIAAGERSLASVGLPFTEHALHLGTGPRSQAVAGGIDTALSAVANSGPGRTVQGLFNPEVMGQFTKVGQSVGRLMYPARQEAAQKTAEQLANFVQPIRQLRDDFTSIFGAEAARFQPHPPAVPGMAAATSALPQVNKQLGEHVFERLFGLQAELGGRLDEAMYEFGLDPNKLPVAMSQQFRSLANDMQTAAQAINQEAIKKGGLGGVLETVDDFEHFARYAKLGDKDYALAARDFATRRGSSLRRSDLIGLIPEEVVNRIATDPLARAKNADDAARAAGHILQRYGSYLGKGSLLDEAGNTVPRWAGIGEHAEALVGWAQEHPLKGIFLNPKIEDWGRYMRQAHIADKSMDVAHELAVRNIAQRLPVDLTAAGHAAEPLVKLPDYYRAAGMNPQASLEYLASMTGKSVDELKTLAVPLEISNAVQATRNFKDDPRWLGALGDLSDQLTSFWKQSVTLPFPGFAARNHFSGQYVNGTSGLMPTLSHAQRYAQHYQQSLAMLRGSIDPALERELLTYDVFNPRQLFEGVESGPYAKFGSAQPANPLDWQTTWQQSAQDVAQAQPFHETLAEIAGRQVPYADRIPAMSGERTAVGAVLGTGAKANQWVEFMNRVPMFQYLKAEGWTAQAAAAKVKELQVDYSRLAPFEKQIMRRLVPFYGWQRAIAPVIMQNLLERPGGAMGMTIRASRLASGADASTPDYVSETLAVPNPFKTPPEGGQSFLAGFGLPHESLAQYGTSLRGAGREVLSQLNPLIKAPMEWATGQSFFQTGANGMGRPLDDMDPVIGRTLSNLAGYEKPVKLPGLIEHLASNSPVSRLLTTGRQLSDPRKTAIDHLLNLTTGVRPIDVSAGARDAVLRQRSQELMKQMDAGQFSKVYFRPEDLAAMSPAERDRAERLQRLQAALATRAKDRVKAKKTEATALATAP